MLVQLSVLAAEGGEKTINPVVPDTIGEIVWGATFFFLLWILMRYVCLPPLMRVREQRDQKVQADREAAAAAETQAEQVRRDYEATLAEARAEATRIVEAARAEAEAERGRRIAEVEAELARERQAAMVELEQARSEALGRIRGEVAELAVAAASKVVQQPLDVQAHRATVEDYVNRARSGR
jgi:F-type H+-transporting ATPase subunit b